MSRTLLPIVNISCHNWYRYMLFVFGTALLIRLAFVLTLQNGFYFPDTVEYSGAAVNLLTHGELGAAYHRPPAYAAFLAAIYAFFGENIFAVMMIESVICALRLYSLASTLN
jgi:hypothetical protein